MATRPEPQVAPLKERSVGSLFAELTRETSRLLRQEIALVKTELADRLGRAGAGLVLVVSGGLILFAGFLVLLAAAVLALALVLAPWLAALAVGAVVALLGLGLVLKGRRDMEARKLMPRRTLRSLRDDAAWAKEQMR